LGVTLVEMAFLVAITGWVEIFVGKSLYLHRHLWSVRIGALALFFANHFLLVARGCGITYEREFRNLDKSRKAVLFLGCTVMLLIAVGFFIYSGMIHRSFIEKIGR